MDDDKKVVDPTTSMLSEFAKLIQEGKKAKEEAEAKKKQTFFEKYKIENTELNPFSFISELAKLKNEAETPEEEIVEITEEVIPEPIVEEKKQSASELLAELASLIQQGKSANKEVFEENEEHLEPFVAEMVQEIVELQQEEVKEEPKPVDLISRTVESITKVAEQNKVNEVTNLFSTPEPDKTSPNFKAIQSKLKSLEQWVSKISTAGAGSGSYWLNDLGDTDKNSLQNATDGQVLTFSADIGKWTAADATGGGGGTVDTTARTIANAAAANTVIIQGVDTAQNTRIGSVETSIINQNNSITNLQNVNITQNNNITTVTSLAQAAFDKANTFVDTYTDQYARDTANNVSSNTIIIQGVDLTQNTNITAADGKAQAAYNQANAGVAQASSALLRAIDANTLATTANTKAQAAFDKANTISANTIVTQGVDSWQNNQITLVNQFAQSAYDKANTFVDTYTDQYARDVANTSSANTIIIQGVDVTQNTRLNALETVNTNQNTSIAIIQGVDLTQNTNITNADAKAQAAFNYANTAITTSGGSITGRLNVSYTPASTTGYALQLTAANTVGGTSYADFLRVTNTSGGVTSPNKSFRVNNIGTLEVINSAYTATLMGISDVGQITLAGASSTNNDPTTNFLSFNNNGLAIYDDGNPHIHARSNGASMWINTNNGAIILGNQGVFSGAAPASAILMGSSTTVKAYCSIYGSKSYAISNYGYLASSGAGQIGGSSGTVPYSLYCDNRINASEIDATSDERAKNIQGTIPLDQAVKFVKEVDGIHYTWNDKAVENDTGLKAGFGAQAVHKAGFEHMLGVIPNDKMEKRVDEDGWVHPEGMQLTMGYNQAIPYHHEVIKHLLQKVEELQNEINILKREKS